MATLLPASGTVPNVQIANKLLTLDTEGRVNGFWNGLVLVITHFLDSWNVQSWTIIISPSVLNHWFPGTNLHWSLNPEERNSNDAPADILIHKNVFAAGGALTSRPCILFEGKSSTGDNFKAIEKQFKIYFESTTFKKIAAGGNKTYYYGIGARGTFVSFWEFQIKDAGDKKLFSMAYNGNNGYWSSVGYYHWTPCLWFDQPQWQGGYC